jgi:hypothetical protein
VAALRQSNVRAYIVIVIVVTVTLDTSPREHHHPFPIIDRTPKIRSSAIRSSAMDG